MNATDRELVMVQVRTLFEPASAEEWMKLPNRLLDGRSPDECIKQGDIQAPLALLAAMQDGAYL